jgi:hypothetical protein
MSLININRQLLPAEQQQLRTYMSEINRMGDLGIKWRRLGEASVTLIERGEYQRMTEMSGAVLSQNNAANVAQILDKAIKSKLAGQGDRLTPKPKIYDVKFLGSNRFLSIAYMLDSEKLEQERQEITTTLDRLNRVNGYWREYEPHVTIATIERLSASDDVLQAFYDISPDDITLLAPTVSHT